MKNCQLSPVESAGFPEGLLHFDYESSVDSIKDWGMVLPPKGDVNNWIVCIHGHGSHGNQLYIRPDIKKAWLPCYLKQGLGIITPNLRNNAWMSPSAVQDMDDILDFVRKKWGDGKFFFSSGSMGATSNLIYASLRPQNVAGIIARGAITNFFEYITFCRKNQNEVPILKEIADCIIESYGGTPEQLPELFRKHSPLFHPEAFKDIPVFLLHGTRDKLMDVAQSRIFAAALANNPLFAYVEIPGGGHDSPLHVPEGSSNDANSLLSWLFHDAKNC